MRQNNFIKVQDRDKPIPQPIQCDSSDISQQHTLNQSFKKQYFHEKLIIGKNKIAIKQIQLNSQNLDNGFYIYKIKENTRDGPSFVISKRKQTSNRITVSTKPIKIQEKLIYFSNKDY